MTDGLRLTPLSGARYRSFNAMCAVTVWHYAKSGPIDQTMEKFGHQNPAHDFWKIERRPAAQPRIGL